MRTTVVGAQLVLALVVSGLAGAQEQSAEPKRNVFAIQPIANDEFGNLLVEYHRRVGTRTTFGASVNLAGVGRYSTISAQGFDLNARYFLTGEAWRGLSVGAAVGARTVYVDQAGPAALMSWRTAFRPTTALTLDYHWTPGATSRFYVSTGAGLEATWRTAVERRTAGVPLARPIGRLAFGFTFEE